MNKIVKNVIQFKKLVQNIRRIVDQTLHRKVWIWQILNCPAYCSWTVVHHIMFFELNLFKDCIKHLEMNLQLFPAIIINISEIFSCGPVNKLWMLFIPYSVTFFFYYYFENECSFHCTSFSLNTLKCTYKKFCL